MPSLACQSQPELFFAEHMPALERAQALCAGCAVADLCLSGALERGEPHGVWGGRILVAGGIVASKRGRGRPRKVA